MTKSSHSRSLRKRLRSLPDPLKGALTIYAAPDAAHKAAEIVADHNAGPYGRELSVIVSHVLDSGRIIGLDKHNRVVLNLMTKREAM